MIDLKWYAVEENKLARLSEQALIAHLKKRHDQEVDLLQESLGIITDICERAIADNIDEPKKSILVLKGIVISRLLASDESRFRELLTKCKPSEEILKIVNGDKNGRAEET